MRRVHALFLAGLAFLTLTASAHGASRGARMTFSPSVTALTLAQQAAGQYWDGAPCGGHVRIRYAPARTAPANYRAAFPFLWAWTTFTTPYGESDYYEPPSTFTNCTVTINRSAWSPAVELASFRAFCGLIVHEYGHLFGYQDSTQWAPTSIRYQEIGPLNERVPPCVARYAEARIATPH